MTLLMAQGKSSRRVQVHLVNVDEDFLADIDKARALSDQSRNQFVTSAVRGHVKRVIDLARWYDKVTTTDENGVERL